MPKLIERIGTFNTLEPLSAGLQREFAWTRPLLPKP